MLLTCSEQVLHLSIFSLEPLVWSRLIKIHRHVKRCIERGSELCLVFITGAYKSLHT